MVLWNMVHGTASGTYMATNIGAAADVGGRSSSWTDMRSVMMPVGCMAAVGHTPGTAAGCAVAVGSPNAAVAASCELHCLLTLTLGSATAALCHLQPALLQKEATAAAAGSWVCELAWVVVGRLGGPR